MARGGFLKKYTWALVVLAISLVVLYFVLNWLHQTFGSNIIGQFAGNVGEYSSGQAYNFRG
jgi:hypothetical protein